MKSRLLAITLAVVLAVVGIVGVLAYARHANDRAINGLKAVSVEYATGPITAGTSLSKASHEGLLSSETVPDSSLPSGAVLSVNKTNETEVVRSTVAKGQVLLDNMLAPAGTLTATSNIVLPVPPGDIGVTMEMCLDDDVAGYVQPGSYIAVFDTLASGGTLTYTCTSHETTTGTSVGTYVVVPKVEVLSVTAIGFPSASSVSGQTADVTTNPASSVSSAGEVLVTLAAVNQQEAEVLISASHAGYPAYGLLTTKTLPLHDDFPANRNSVQSQLGS